MILIDFEWSETSYSTVSGSYVYGETVRKSKSFELNQNEATESEVWKVIGSFLPQFQDKLLDTSKTPFKEEGVYAANMVVSVLNVQTNFSYGSATINLKQRGTYVEKGVICPSMYIVIDNAIDLPPSNYPEMFLTCLHAESNSNKFYRLIPNNDNHTVNVCWGRTEKKSDYFSVLGHAKLNLGFIDEPKYIKQPYPSYLFWVRVYEKLSKGYKDNSAVYLDTTKKKVSRSAKVSSVSQLKSLGDEKASTELFSLLLSYSANTLKRYTTSNLTFTWKQYEEAKKFYRGLLRAKTLRGVNNNVSNLIQILPRSMYNVSQNLATTMEEKETIVDRESNLINSMFAVLTSADNVCKGGLNNFSSLNTEVYYATPEQVEQVKAHLRNSRLNLSSRVKTVYRVIPHTQKAKFDAYLTDTHISKVVQLWHGSRSCNWLSIIHHSLQLNPDAIITGKMFGDGIYFASKCDKAFNYTSINGSYWARGTDTEGIMGLYATAYGNPLFVSRAHRYTSNDLQIAHKDCVHAQAGQHLLNDEIIYYNESAVCLQYLVVFS